jgi:predicted RNA-binding Zn-ribbon protein involved in translation (DUF1610 family)
VIARDARAPMFACQECRKRFVTLAAAERAVRRGCPRCGSVDIDLAPTADLADPAAPTRTVQP